MGIKSKIYTALTLTVLIATNASAQTDLSWLDTANDCDSFSAGVVKFQHSLSLKSALSESDRANLKLILKEACTERFSACGFSFCKSSEAPAASQGEAAPIARSAQLRPAIVTDPLAWLEEPLQCEDLVDQIKARYAPLGSYSNLPAMKKDELGKVLDVACSDRFSHCRFPSCGQDKTSKVAQKNPDAKAGRARLAASSAAVNALVDDSASHKAALKVEADAQVSAQRVALEQLYAEKSRERRLQIERAVADEKAKGAAWKIFSIPGEIESRMSAESDDDGAASDKRSVNPATSKLASYAAVDDSVSQQAVANQSARTSRLNASSEKNSPQRAGHDHVSSRER